MTRIDDKPPELETHHLPEGEDTERSEAQTGSIDVTELEAHLELCRAEPVGSSAARRAPIVDERVPVIIVAPTDIRWHRLDYRAGFLLSRVDGSRTYLEVIETSGMARSEAVAILQSLLEAGVITERDG